MDFSGWLVVIFCVFLVSSWFIWACGGRTVTKWFCEHYVLRPCGFSPFVALDNGNERFIDTESVGEEDHENSTSYVEML